MFFIVNFNYIAVSLFFFLTLTDKYVTVSTKSYNINYIPVSALSTTVAVAAPRDVLMVQV